jgi:hypothetical protein
MERVPRGRPKCCAGAPGTCFGREAIALRIGAEGGLGFRADLSHAEGWAALGTLPARSGMRKRNRPCRLH